MSLEYNAQEVIMDTKETVLENIEKELLKYWDSIKFTAEVNDLYSLSQDEREDLLDYFFGNNRFSSEDPGKIVYLSSKQRLKKQTDRNRIRSSSDYVHTPTFLSLRTKIVKNRISIIKGEISKSYISYSEKQELARKLDVDY